MREFIPSIEEGDSVPPLECAFDTTAVHGLMFVVSGAFGILQKAENLRGSVRPIEDTTVDFSRMAPIITGFMAVAPSCVYRASYDQFNLWRASRLESRAMKLIHGDS